MTLFGATHSCALTHFPRSGLIQGVFSGLIGVILLISVLFSLHKEMPELLVLQDMYTIVLIFVGILLFGVLMSVIVTNIAVGKYLKMNENDLYH